MSDVVRTGDLYTREAAEHLEPVLPLCYHSGMGTRKKRSISVPPDLDSKIESAASKAGMTYSGWLMQAARKEFTIRAGLAAVAEFEREHGRFSPEELAEAAEWAESVVRRGKRTRPGRSRTA